MQLTGVERAIVDYVAKDNPVAELLAQISAVRVASREHTGVGLYTNFGPFNRELVKSIVKPCIPYGGPYLCSPVLKHGAGSVIWCDDEGYLSCIEIFAYSGDYPVGEFDFFAINPEELPEAESTK